MDILDLARAAKTLNEIHHEYPDINDKVLKCLNLTLNKIEDTLAFEDAHSAEISALANSILFDDTDDEEDDLNE